MGRWDKKDGKPSAEEKFPAEEKRSGKEKRFAGKKHSKEKHFIEGKDSGKNFTEEYSDKKMECKDFEKRIPDFIAKKMDYPTL